MALTAGERLGPYEVLAPIGAGGMGEVYKALDTRLDRTVAIKVLPARLAGNLELKQRFEREARAVAALNHPNICVLYDIGHQDGTDFLVMEHLQGETLAKRLEKGPLPIDQALPYAVQIADALEKAHRQGVLHRDLKPANVMLTKSGAKLLDFGLAKESGATASAAAAMTLGPTQAGPLTAEGTLVGTFQYMAPELFEGKDADARSDIFGFGVTLYEMLTGRRAFEGKTQASVIAAVMEREPQPISAVVPMTPPALDRAVKLCLTKDPDERWQTAHDVKLQLQWVMEGGSQAGIPAPVVASRKLSQVFAWSVAALCLLGALAMGAALLFRTPRPTLSMQALLLPPKDQSISGSFAVSPDGKKLVFSVREPGKDRVLWVRPLNSTTAQLLAGTQKAEDPFWSPDGRSIGFFSENKLRKIDAAGGPVITLADSGFSPGGSWGPDGNIVFARGMAEGLHQVSSAGGPVSQVLKPTAENKLQTIRWPFLLPDGRHLLFANDPAEIHLLDLKTGKTTALLQADSNAQFADGHLFYLHQGNLMAQALDVSAARLSGSPVVVAQGVMDKGRRLGAFSVGGSAVAFQVGVTGLYRLVWYSRSGNQLGQVRQQDRYSLVSLSPDGTRAATVLTDAQGKRDIWILELSRGSATRLTFDAQQANAPVWSRDGNRVFYCDEKGIFVKASSGLGASELVLEGVWRAPNSLSPDGKLLAYITGKQLEPRLWIHQLAPEARSYELLQTNFSTAEGQFSPDGRWLAYVSRETGRFEVYVVPFPTLSNKWQVSTEGGAQPRWRRDGREIYYVSPNRKMMAATIEAAGNSIKPGVPVTLFQTRILAVTQSFHHYDVAPDGQKFLVVSYADEAFPPITLYANWAVDVKRK